MLSKVEKQEVREHCKGLVFHFEKLVLLLDKYDPFITEESRFISFRHDLVGFMESIPLDLGIQ